MEEQDFLNKPIGTRESVKLKPAELTIKEVTVEPVPGEKELKKVVCHCLHPAKPNETIKISSVRWIITDKVKTMGLWLQVDEDGNIQKDSALAALLTKLDSKTLKELEGKKCNSDLDGKYLVFKLF